MNYLRYTGVIIGLTVGLPLLLSLLRWLTGINLASAFLVIVPAMAGAMIEGQKFATGQLRIPSRAETARFVVLATVIATGFQFLFAAAVVTNVPGYERLLTAPPSAALVIGALVFVAAVIAFCNLMFLRIGAKSQLKRQNATDVFK